MADIGFVSDNNLDWDYSFDGVDLSLDEGIQTAILISLYTDKRIGEKSAVLPDGDTDKKGWWADETLENEGDQIGSHLWTLWREPVNERTARKEKEYVEECLAWMIEDNVCSSFEVETEPIPLSGRINIKITLFKGEDILTKYETLWGTEIGI